MSYAALSVQLLSPVRTYRVPQKDTDSNDVHAVYGVLIVVHVNCLVYVHDDVTVGVVGTLKPEKFKD